ncbi:MAG: efflux transporter outer membrane subunit [Alphaproteobacteria bacterium]|nr:MAG: efflux transporter outer membrane subunit [Alphaproteobacteria bacterium]
MKKILPLTLLLLTACNLAPDYERPSFNMPESWRNKSITENAAQNAEWWQGFKSEELNALVTRALDSNLDIEASIARLEQARADAKIAGSSLWPDISASGNVGQEWQARGRNRDASSNNYRAGLAVGYEVDLWGRNRAARDSAEARVKASEFDRNIVRLLTISDVTKSYLGILALSDQLQFAQKNLDNAQELMNIVQARYDAGSVSNLELAQQKSDLASVEASMASLQQQKEALHNGLALLLGDFPQNWDAKESSLNSVAAPSMTVIHPADLLDRRPDILAAEQNLIAANIDIGEARSAFYPLLDLSLDTALSANPISASAMLANSIAAALSVPIFTGGALEGAVEGAEARKRELIAAYRKTVLSAFGEVDTALSDIEWTGKRFEALKVSTDQARDAYEIARLRYDNGSIDFQELLIAQRDVIQKENSLVQGKLDQFTAAIDLKKALAE